MGGDTQSPLLRADRYFAPEMQIASSLGVTGGGGAMSHKSYGLGLAVVPPAKPKGQVVTSVFQSKGGGHWHNKVCATSTFSV